MIGETRLGIEIATINCLANVKEQLMDHKPLHADCAVCMEGSVEPPLALYHMNLYGTHVSHTHLIENGTDHTYRDKKDTI